VRRWRRYHRIWPTGASMQSGHHATRPRYIYFGRPTNPPWDSPCNVGLLCACCPRRALCFMLHSHVFCPATPTYALRGLLAVAQNLLACADVLAVVFVYLNCCPRHRGPQVDDPTMPVDMSISHRTQNRQLAPAANKRTPHNSNFYLGLGARGHIGRGIERSCRDHAHPHNCNLCLSCPPLYPSWPPPQLALP